MKNKCLLAAAWIFCFLIISVSAQNPNPKLQDNVYLSKGLTVTNVTADDGKLELKVTVFNHTPTTIKGVVQVYAFPYGFYLTDSYSFEGLTIVLKRLEQYHGGSSSQQAMNAIPLSRRIKPPFDFSLKSEAMAWWRDKKEIEFRPNASREIIYSRLPARFVPNQYSRTQLFYPDNEFVAQKGSTDYNGSLCYAPISLAEFNLSSFYVVVDDSFQTPKRLNSTFFLDRWAEYDKKKAQKFQAN